ncbi:hypothetical protein Ancab_002722 [Ancistrocladus abbreviatus]
MTTSRSGSYVSFPQLGSSHRQMFGAYAMISADLTRVPASSISSAIRSISTLEKETQSIFPDSAQVKHVEGEEVPVNRWILHLMSTNGWAEVRLEEIKMNSNRNFISQPENGSIPYLILLFGRKRGEQVLRTTIRRISSKVPPVSTLSTTARQGA